MTERNRDEAADDQARIGIRFSMVSAPMSSEGAATVPYQRFVASLKTLFSDFVVREQSALVENGKPLQLTTFKLASGDTPRGDDASSHSDQAETGKCTPSALEASVRVVFTPLIGAEDTEQLIALTEASFSDAPSELTSITLQPIADKAARSEVHRQVKAVFANRLLSETSEGKLVIRKATQALLREQDRRTRASTPLPFLHFTLYKENLDSNSALRMVAQQIGLNAKSLMFSGTKDKRGVTLQRVACRGLDVQRLLRVNRNQFGRNAKLKVGNMEMRKEGLTLGDLVGNTFEIVLRVVKSASADDEAGSSVFNRAAFDGAISRLQTYGFPNYFGPQRFGTTSILTSDVGRALLRGAFREAALMVLRSRCEVSPEATPAVDLVERNDDAEGALAAMPHYCFLERDILKHLVRSPGDWRGCFTCVPRTTAMLYYHSVQSLIWNMIASKRLAAHGPVPVVGDLVAAVSGQHALATAEDVDDASVQQDAKEKLIAVRRLTQDDIAANKYGIKDVLLTVPGCDPALEYPSSACADRDAYNELITSVGCPELLTDPHDVAKLYHFHGTYRSLVVIPQNMRADVREVATFRTPVLETDLEKIYKGWNADKAARVKRAREEEDMKAQQASVIAPVEEQQESALVADSGALADDADVPQEESAPLPEDVGEVAALPSAPDGPADTSPSTQPSVPCTAVVVAFGLPPGAYATSLIRELCIAVKE
jgi:tRNA pseudouridine13 synthase